MLASGIWKGWARGAARSPATWGLVLMLALACPLSSRLSPFPELGLDPMGSLLRSWSVPAAVLGSGLALVHLSRRAAFLQQVAPRTRWLGELGTIALASFAAQAAVLLGASVGGSGTASLASLGLLGWLAGCLALDLHLAALASLLLRVPAPASVLGVLWWMVLLLGPQALGVERMPMPLDIARHLGEVGAPRDGWDILATGCLIAGLLGLGTLACTRRGASPGKQGGVAP